MLFRYTVHSCGWFDPFEPKSTFQLEQGHIWSKGDMFSFSSTRSCISLNHTYMALTYDAASSLSHKLTPLPHLYWECHLRLHSHKDLIEYFVLASEAAIARPSNQAGIALGASLSIDVVTLGSGYSMTGRHERCTAFPWTLCITFVSLIAVLPPRS